MSKTKSKRIDRASIGRGPSIAAQPAKPYIVPGKKHNWKEGSFN